MYYVMNITFLLYFVVLFIERGISVVKSARKKEMFTDGLNRYMYCLTFLSMAASVILLILYGRNMFLGLGGDKELLMFRIPYQTLSLIAGVALFSGMVHTNYTIPGLQFVAYGMLIVSMVCKVLIALPVTGLKPAFIWVTLAYVVAFSMAIPVVYRSEMKNAKLFHILECVVSAVLVLAFTFMLRTFYGNSLLSILNIGFLATVIIGDGALIIMRWKEQKNWFVLVALCAAAILWIPALLLK